MSSMAVMVKATPGGYNMGRVLPGEEVHCPFAVVRKTLAGEYATTSGAGGNSTLCNLAFVHSFTTIGNAKYVSGKWTDILMRGG